MNEHMTPDATPATADGSDATLIARAISEVAGGTFTRNYDAVYGPDASPEDLFERLPWVGLPSPMGIPLWSCVAEVTPAMAELFLKRRDLNRPLTAAGITYHLRQLRGGFYRYNAQGMAFTRNGLLLDGQNRSVAVSLLGRGEVWQLNRGIPSEAFSTMDSGIPRGSSLALRQAGRSDPDLRVAILRRLLNFEDGIVSDVRKTSGAEMMDAELRYGPILNEAMDVAYLWYSNRLTSPSLAGTAYALAAVADRDAAREFFRDVGAGTYPANSDHPSASLRRWLNKRHSSYRLRSTEFPIWMSGICTAWTYYRLGRRSLANIYTHTRDGALKPIVF